MQVMDTEQTKKTEKAAPKKRRIGKVPGAVILIAALVLSVTAISAGAYAVLSHRVSNKNVLTAGAVDGKVDEPVVSTDHWTNGTRLNKQVQIKSTGETAAFVRIAYAETMTAGSSWLAMTNTDVDKHWTPAFSSEWVDGGDGWYYYKKVLPGGATSAQIMDYITMKVDPTTEDGDQKIYNLNFTVEMVQVSTDAALNSAATAAAFGKTGTVSGIMTDSNNNVTGGTVTWS